MRLLKKFVSPKPLLNFCQKRNVLRELRTPQVFRHYAAFRRPSKVFRWERWVFAVFSWGRMVFQTYAYPFGYFLNVLLPLVLLMILLILFSWKVRKCLRSTASPLCWFLKHPKPLTWKTKLFQSRSISFLALWDFFWVFLFLVSPIQFFHILQQNGC